MAYTKEILTLAVEIGNSMLRNGAEIYRVQDSITHILKSYEVEEFDVYVLSNGIFASANENKEDACSLVRYVPLGSVNLGKVAALNQLTRDICTHDCSLIDAWDRLDECNNLEGYPIWLQILSCGLGSGCFCYLFGERILDSFFATIIGCIVLILQLQIRYQKMSKFISNIILSLVVTILSMILCCFNLNVMQDKIIIGALMPLVPGIAFTTSIRDFYNSDYLSGIIHLIDAILTAICIAVGACLPLILSELNL